MTGRTTHGGAGHEDLALWYACEVALDHPQATYADRRLAQQLLREITRSVA